MNIKTVYGIHGNNSVTFLDLIAAEKYLFNNYQEYIIFKDQFIEYCEQMIWEDTVKTCEGCGTKILRSDMDSDWVRSEGCCECSDVWLCGCRH